MEWFNESHCVDGGGMVGYYEDDAVYVVPHSYFREDASIQPNDQLFYAYMRVNEFIVGTWLTDSSNQVGVHYQDIAGRLDTKHFPPELKEALRYIRVETDEPGPAQEMEMA